MKKIIAFFISALLVFSLSSCSSGGETYKKDMLDLFDTASSISAADSSQADFNSHFDSVYNELLRYSRLFDIYKDYQGVVNLKYINENAAAAPVKADKAIIDLLLFGKQAYEITGGRYILPWAQCFRFGTMPLRRPPRIPKTPRCRAKPILKPPLCIAISKS